MYDRWYVLNKEIMKIVDGQFWRKPILFYPVGVRMYICVCVCECICVYIHIMAIGKLYFMHFLLCKLSRLVNIIYVKYKENTRLVNAGECRHNPVNQRLRVRNFFERNSSLSFKTDA